MKKLIGILVILMVMSSIAFAGQRYNAMENRWETVPDDWNVEYNPMEDSWSYQPEEAEIEYNPMEDTWDWNSGHGND